MKLISHRTLREFAAMHPESNQTLQEWRRLIERNCFPHFAAIKQVFNSVDKVRELTVFNIGGNKFRLIAYLQFDKQVVYVKAVLTHKEYDKGGWKS